MRSLYTFYINGSLHVAVAATCLVFVTGLQSFGMLPIELGLVIGCGTVASYNFVKGYDGPRTHGGPGAVVAVSVLCLLVATYFFFFLTWSAQICLILGLVLTMLYAVPVWHHRNWRALPVVKPVIVALVWMLTTQVAVNLNHHDGINPYTALERVLFVFALTMPFEIRDLQYDDIQLGTLPQLIGVKATKWIGTGCLLVAGLLALANVGLGVDGYVNSGVYLITLLMLWGSGRNRKDNYVTVAVEAIPIAWLLLYLIVDNL